RARAGAAARPAPPAAGPHARSRRRNPRARASPSAAAATGGTADAREARLMGMLAWVMMGLALWHFTIWLPDRFWGGIVGAFVGALMGAILLGLIVTGGAVPGSHDTDLAPALG